MPADPKGRIRPLSPEAESLKSFVEAVLEIGSWKVSKSQGPTISLMEWRHHSFETTLKGLTDGNLVEKYVVQSGHPLAVREWLGDATVETSRVYKPNMAMETWPLDRIRDELIGQEIVRWWPQQAMRIIAFVLERDAVVESVDYELLSSMNRRQLNKQVFELGFSQLLEAPKRLPPKRRAGTLLAESRRSRVNPEKKFESWLDVGAPWIRAAGLKGSEYRHFLRRLFDAGNRWPSPRDGTMPTPKSREWLQEILARAVDLAPMLRLEPAWPVSFDDQQHRMTISVVGNSLVAWVEIGRARTLLAVDLETLEFRCRGDKRRAEVAAGLAIGWYLDSCVCLRSSRHPHFKTPSGKAGGKHRTSRPGLTYLPTPRFLGDVESARSGLRNPPRAHDVKGHVRELSPVRSPSKTARSNAPSYIQRNLRHNETFVRSHSRGKGGKSRTMKVYLSKYSTLADIIGWL
jgi:hypothetical protein